MCNDLRTYTPKDIEILKLYEDAPMTGLRCAVVNPQGTLAIRESRQKLYGLIAVSAVFTSMGVWQLVELGADNYGTRDWVGLIGFGAGLVVFLAKLLFGHRAPLTLSPEGIRDARTMQTVIPWTDVVGVSTHSITRHATYLKLHVSSEVLDTHPKRRLRSKRDYILVRVDTLEPTLDDLIESIERYARNFNPNYQGVSP